MSAVYYVLLGPPGAGKGTQAKLLAESKELTHISSGDIFRDNLENQTDLGKRAKGYMDRGELVPDDLTISMIRERLKRSDCVNGAILDGFPRTPAQADALANMLKEWNAQVSAVPYISVPPEILLERLTGRWTCRTGGHVYHMVHNPPKVAGICDQDGSELYQRDDDKTETVKRRISVYLNQTAPLIDYYKRQNLLVEIDGTRTIEHVTRDLLTRLG
jgi:adenylate kinase